MIHPINVEFNSVPYDTRLRNVRALTSAVKYYWMYFVESHILIPHSWIKIPHFRLYEMEKYYRKVLQIKTIGLVLLPVKFSTEMIE